MELIATKCQTLADVQLMFHNNGQNCQNQHFCKGLLLCARVLIAAAILADINPRKKYNQRMIIRFRPFVLQSKFDQSLLTGSWWGPLGAAETVLYMLSIWPLGILVHPNKLFHI